MPKRTLSLWSLILLAGGGGGPRPLSPPGTSSPNPFIFVHAEDGAPLPEPVEEAVPEDVTLTGFVDGDVGTMTTTKTMEKMDDSVVAAVPPSVKVKGEPLAFEEEVPAGQDDVGGDFDEAAAQAVAAIGDVGEADPLFVGGGVEDDPTVAVAFDPIVATEEKEMCEDDDGNKHEIGKDIHGRPIDLFCSDDSKMEGITEKCTDTGKIEKEDYELGCPPNAPLCVQIGDEADGVAECLSRQDAIRRGYLEVDLDLDGDGDSLDNVTTVTNMTTATNTTTETEQSEDERDIEDDESKGCVVGALKFANEESVGYKGIWCRMDDPDGKKFEGEESVCMDGDIEELENEDMSCPDERPHCVQCGWDALCVSDLTSADLQDCKGVNLVEVEPVVKCEVGGILYDVDDPIGQKTVDSCIDGEKYMYNGRESLCGADGIVFDRSAQFQCGDDTPYCVQCDGDDVARCLSEPDCDSDSDSESGESTSLDELEDALISGGNAFDSIPRTSNGAAAASMSSGVASVRLDPSTRLLSWVFAFLVPPLLRLQH